MPSFKYAALGADNQLIKGQLSAISGRLAEFRLEKKGYLLVNIKKEPSLAWRKLRTLRTINRLEKIQLTRLLHTFLSSGVPLNKAVSLAVEQAENARMAEILRAVESKIRGGQPLSSALEPYIRVFGAYYVKLIRVGEDSGALDDTLLHLLEQQEKEYALVSNVRGALIYPAIVVTAALAAVVFLLAFVIPAIGAVLASYGGELPLYTRAMIAVSDFLVGHWLYLAPGAILAIIASRAFFATRIGRWHLEACLLRLPLTRKMAVEYNIARVMRALWTPIKGGLSINKALDLVADTCGNRHYKRSIEQSAELVRRGLPLSEVLRGHSRLYPPSVCGLIEVGESTGRTDDMLKRLSDYYDYSVNQTFKNLSAILEPFLIIFVGLVIGFIAVSVLTPIWTFSETI